MRLLVPIAGCLLAGCITGPPRLLDRPPVETEPAGLHWMRMRQLLEEQLATCERILAEEFVWPPAIPVSSLPPK